MWPFTTSAHQRSCHAKQQERTQNITNLTDYQAALTPQEKIILDQPIATTISQVQNGETPALGVLKAYGKQALKAHSATNCLTEVMILSGETWARECNTKGPLAGIPISLKDTVGVKGWDSSIGDSAWVGKPSQQDSALVRLLRDAGAVPFVKTNIPITLLSFESANDVFGRTTNAHNAAYSPGGSSGGEAALLAYGGSRVGIGTDVAGSVRVPAHYSGVYTIKASTTRFPKVGSSTSIPGQEGVAPVYSPMTRTLEDLETFWRAVVGMKPWTYDHTCIALPWRSINLEPKKLKWGVLWDDETVVESLEKRGNKVVPINPPSPAEALKIGTALLLADACKTVCLPMRPGESNDAGIVAALSLFSLPRWVKRLYAWYLRRFRQPSSGNSNSTFDSLLLADLIENFHEQSITEYWSLVARREDYKRRWFEMWNEQELDFVITVPNAFPAVPHGGMKDGYKACGYTFIFNLLDYTAGVLPVTHVDSAADALPASFKPRNAIEKGSYKAYDAHAMHGLPVGVQIVGRKLEEEKVMEGMKMIEQFLREDGQAYQLFQPE